MAVLDPVREQTMLTQLVRDVPADGFSAVSLERILQSVFAASREVVAAPQKHRGPT